MSIISFMTAVLELTRFDRDLVKAIATRLLCLSTLQVVIFGPWAQSPEYSVQSNVPIFFCFFMVVTVILGFSDAAPAYPHGMRVGAAAVLFLNSLRALMQNYLHPYYNAHTVCFVFCTDTAVLALAPTATCVIFLGKYVYSLVRYRNRSIIACMHLHFSVTHTVSSLPSSSSHDGVSDRTRGGVADEMGGELVTDAAAEAKDGARFQHMGLNTYLGTFPPEEVEIDPKTRRGDEV